MILKSDRIADRLEQKETSDPLVITPQPSVESLKKGGAASVDLRLGTWFVTLRKSRKASFSPGEEATEPVESRLTKKHYVPFGKDFILHPRNFVLGVTLEWIRVPGDLAGYVVGKSSWGRHGLVIATAVGVHPGFAGCLTLELSNLGEIPIHVKPGMTICQLFLHKADSSSERIDLSRFVGQRRPALGTIKTDDVAKRLGQAQNLQ